MTQSGDGSRKYGKTATHVVHSGRDPSAQHGFVNPPVYRGSTVVFPNLAELENYDNQKFSYGRHGTPTTIALEEALCGLEGGARTFLMSSGYQAVTTTLLAFVKTGDHILMVDSVYQPTRKFCDSMLAPLGVRTTYYDPTIGAGIADLIEDNTKVIFTESPGSLTFEVQDVPAIAAVGKERDIWVVTDNTWATGHYFRPLDHGVDVSINAATKYIVGHADALLGAVTVNERARAHVNRSRALLGVCPGSEETFLGLRGLRTLDVRLERHHKNGLQLAEWLETRDEVAEVRHPALPSAPGHDLWKRDFTGASGLFSIELKPFDRDALARMLDGLELFGMGYSWGGYESLIIPFNPTQFRTATKWTADGPALRIHAGLDDQVDLIADLEQGFRRLRGEA